MGGPACPDCRPTVPGRPAASLLRRQDARSAQMLKARDKLRTPPMLNGVALSAHAYKLTLRRRTERTEKEAWSGKVAVPDEGRRPCSGRDFSSAAEVRKPMAPPRRSGKCGVSDLGKGWSPPGANSSPAAASPGKFDGKTVENLLPERT